MNRCQTHYGILLAKYRKHDPFKKMKNKIPNINKFFKYISIRRKLIVAFTLLSVLPLLIVGIFGIIHNISNMHKIALENLKYDHNIRHERAENFFKLIGDDINFIAHSPPFTDFVESFYNQTGRLDLKRKRAGELLTTFCQEKKDYYQIYFIDNRHRQIFKVESEEDGKFIIIPPEKLDRGHFPFYFYMVKNLQPGKMAFVPVELSTRNNAQISAISFASPVYMDGSFAGILVADLRGKSLFDVIESPSILNFHHHVSIVNGEGFYVYDSNRKKHWNQLLASRNTINLFSRYTKEVTDSILSGRSGVITALNDEIITYSPLINSHFSVKSSYILINSISQKYITTTMFRSAEIFIPILIIFLVLSVYFATIATKQLITPIQQLKDEAQIIASGNYSHSFKINTNDEIEDLAKQFNLMANAIRNREKLLSDQQANLEKTVLQRTRQLQDEQNKIRAILNNIPSAFILYSAEGTILLVSEAISSFIGLSPQLLTGKKCDELLWPDTQAPFVPAQFSFDLQNPVMQIQEISIPGKDPRIIEHILLPVRITSSESAALHMITDITEKRQLENHLIKIEKLVATGQLSAILAHELRNSVTSIKMILQLQLEKSTNPKDRDSLRVAMDSVLNMETILNNLLKFARPAPLQLLKVNINNIIEDALIFLEPRIRKKNINLTKKLDKKLVPQKLDATHLKEAFINIILNAAQVTSPRGKLTITTERIKLNHQIQDFGYDDHHPGNADQGFFRIDLPANKEVILIRIEDSGPGIPKKDIEKIFDPFFTTKLDGTGLGLAITKRVINQHNGIIQVKSRPKNGTTFLIYLPLEKANVKT